MIEIAIDEPFESLIDPAVLEQAADATLQRARRRARSAT